MESNVGGPAAPAAATLGGQLIQLVDVRDDARFSREVTRICTERTTKDRPDYHDVLAWVIDAIVCVIIARLGATNPDQTYVLDIRSPDDTHFGFDDLPDSERFVLRTLFAFLADDPTYGHNQLTDAAHQTDPATRAETLANALIWLDFLLDVELPDPPDVPPHSYPSNGQPRPL
jgi:hypothetical protein